MSDIQENILLYSETVINTVCRSIQVSVQKICERVTLLENKNGALIWDSMFLRCNLKFYTFLHMGHTK
jgi:hypothetical protein